jgi:hypothetical protein
MAKTKGNINVPSHLRDLYDKSISFGSTSHVLKKHATRIQDFRKERSLSITPKQKHIYKNLRNIGKAWKNLSRKNKLKWFNYSPVFPPNSPPFSYFTVTSFKSSIFPIFGVYGVIFKITNYKITIPSGLGTVEIPIDVSDKNKTAIFLQGNSYAFYSYDDKISIISVSPSYELISKTQLLLSWNVTEQSGIVPQSSIVNVQVVEYL